MSKIFCFFLIVNMILCILALNSKIENKIGANQDPEEDSTEPESLVTFSPEGPCSLNGCFGELCTRVEEEDICPEDAEWKPEYICNNSKNCALINDQCVWVETEEFQECVAAVTSEEGCWISGCYGELCTDKPNLNENETCEWKAEYECLKYSKCLKNNGICAWETINVEYQKCYGEALRNPTTIAPVVTSTETADTSIVTN